MFCSSAIDTVKMKLLCFEVVNPLIRHVPSFSAMLFYCSLKISIKHVARNDKHVERTCSVAMPLTL